MPHIFQHHVIYIASCSVRPGRGDSKTGEVRVQSFKYFFMKWSQVQPGDVVGLDFSASPSTIIARTTVATDEDDLQSTKSGSYVTPGSALALKRHAFRAVASAGSQVNLSYLVYCERILEFLLSLIISL